MFRKSSAGIVGLVLAGLSVAACGSGSDESASSDGSNKSGLPGVVKLVSIQDLSGPAGLPGVATQKGMKVAVSEINDTGFLGSSKLEIEYKDSATNPTTGASLFNQAVNSDVPLAFGSISSTAAVAEAPVAQRGRLPTIFTQAASKGVVEAGEYIYRATPTQSSYIDVTGQYMQKKGFKTVAIITATDNPTTVALTKDFSDMGAKYGYTIVAREQTTLAATDLSAQMSKIAGHKPDAVVILVGANATAVTQLRQAGYSGPIIGNVGMGGGSLKSLGSAANGIVWATDFNAQQSNSGAQRFVKLYRDSYNETPNNFAAEGYDAVWFAARALKDAGSVSRDAVLQALARVAQAGFSGALGDIKFNENREEIIGAATLVTMQDGTEVPIGGQ